MEAEKYDKIVPDTSVIIEGLLSAKIKDGKIRADSIIIHEAVLAELEHQANQNRAIGFLGLEELKKLKKLSQENNFAITFSGRKPTLSEIKYASLGEVDYMIRELAFDEDATLFTADKIQSEVAQAKGIRLLYEKVEQLHKQLLLEKFFDNTTMSVHLRENVEPYAKKGVPGNWQFVKVRDSILTRDEIQDISREIIEEAGIRKDAFIEIERPGSTIVQLGNFRIVITKPPFSDGWEITAVRPVKRMSLSDYRLSEKLGKRIAEQAEGVLIAGSPGMGKSTFAQALAEFYAGSGKIVKTVEAPRDMVLPDNVTQYAISHGDAQEIHDILLLSRPDYTIFDEMRNTDDFRLFADLRLAGIGLAGVVHATNPIDAIQRFVGRIELGVIPQVIDTVIFIKNGSVFKVLSLNMTVKVPSGMTEADLARPVVVVNDFETGKLEYELYSYGEETVVVPVREGGGANPMHKLAAKSIEQEFRHYSSSPKVEMLADGKCVVYVPESDIARIIGRQGKNISDMEERLGISVEVRDIGEMKKGKPMPSGSEGSPVSYDAKIMKKGVVFEVGHEALGRDVDIFVGDDYLLTAKVGKTGIIKVHKNNKIGRILMDAVNMGDKIRLVAK
jgi:ATPase